MSVKKESVDFKLTYKKRNEYISEQKEAIISKVGKARAILLMQKTPRGEIRERKLNPSKPNSPIFYYVEHAYVSEILNLAFVLDWDLVVDKTERIDQEVIVEGHLTVRIKGKEIKKYGSGGAKKLNNPNQTWADVYNSATSKLLKVCAARLGLGLDLYRHEEAESEKITSQLVAKTTILEDGIKAATEAQKATLTSLKVDYPDDITKQEAADLIRKSAQKG